MYKLADFGSSRDMYEIGKGDFPMGTLHYAAPELLTRRRIYGINDPFIDSMGDDAIRTDIYSLGMVLYELLTWEVLGRIHGPGEGPYNREEWFQYRREREESNGDDEHRWYYSREKMPKALWEVALKATSANPLDRYRSADDMLEAIERAEKADAGTRSCTRENELAKIGEAFHAFLSEDSRKALMLRYPKGTFQCNEKLNPFVGRITGFRLTCIGHEPPEAILINGEEIDFRPENGFINLSLTEIFGERTWPDEIEIEVRYPRGWKHQWSIICKDLSSVTRGSWFDPIFT